jgi:hypothetical protein
MIASRCVIFRPLQFWANYFRALGVGDLLGMAIAYCQYSRNLSTMGVGELLDENPSHPCSGFGIVREL